MKRGASSIEVKKLNRNRVFRYLNSRDRASMPDIAASLGMSGPTVLQIIKELKESQVVREVGVFQSTGGRKAKAIASVQDVCYAVGLDITRNHVSLALTNLSEKVLRHQRVREPFVRGDEYFRRLGDLLEDFLDEGQMPREKIIGVGLSIPGIIDEENCIAYSHTLGLDHVAGEEFTRYIPYPCVIINDANAAAIAECSGSALTQSVFYLLLSNSVGGAIVFCRDAPAQAEWSVREGISRNIYMGGNQRAGEFGHMVIRPKGRACYCGKNGCLDVYCSASILADRTEGNLERFFQELEEGNSQWREIWEEYTDNLAIAVDNLRMCFDGDVVLGGYVGGHMGSYIEDFRAKCAKRNIFGKSGDYVKACKYRIEASALGAAVCQIERYIDKV